MKAMYIVSLLLAVCCVHVQVVHAQESYISCADAQNEGNEASGEYQIDPDGDGGLDPFTVYCDMSGEQAITVVHHNLELDNEEDRLVNNCEDPGSCKIPVEYTGSIKQVSALADLSSYCEQFINYKSYASVLWWKCRGRMKMYGWWENRDYKQMKNWGGVPTGGKGCACSATSQGCREHKYCNSDSNVHQFVEDGGMLNDKRHLPVRRLRFGDTGSNRGDEYSYYELGPLRCQGGPTRNEKVAPIFETNTDYMYRYDLPQLKAGECRLEFEVAACNNAFIGFSDKEGEQTDLIELNIGGWQNSKTVFRNCKQCNVEAEVEKSVLHCDEMTRFSVDWCDGTFRLSREGDGQILTWNPLKQATWKYIAYSTGYGSTGRFKFDSLYAKEIYVCENGIGDINCGSRYVNVLFAKYGRSSNGICPSVHAKSTDCSSLKSIRVVGNLCHNQHECKISADSGVFGDPCSGTPKYLHVKYQCLEERINKQFTDDACSSNMCNLQGGECVPRAGNTYLCSCKAGYGGQYCEETYAECRGWGDPHYALFNGQKVNYQGMCKYILAEPCSGDSTFRIIGVNEPPQDGRTVSYNRGLELEIGGLNIVLLREKKVAVNDVIKNLPFFYDPEDIQIRNERRFLVVSSAKYGLNIYWDGVEVFEIFISIDKYKDNLCGLCGGVNEVGDGYFIMRSGEKTKDVNKFGDSWVANPLSCEKCDNCARPKNCDEDADLFNSIKNACSPCSPTRDPNGVFSFGHLKFASEMDYESCIFDMCSRPEFDEAMRCRSLEEYVNKILLDDRSEVLKNGGQILEWRKILDCPFDCPIGSVYSLCADPCPRTCFQPIVPAACSSVCVEGCNLGPGLIMENGVPVPEDQCGCRYHGNYYPIGQKWINSECSESCECTNGIANCHPVSCAEHAYCGSSNQVHGCHCEDNYIGNGREKCQMPCQSNMGNEAKIRALVDEGQHAIIDASHPIACEGYITSFTIKRHDDSMIPITLVVWRQNPQDPEKFVIVGSANLPVTDDTRDLCACSNSKIPVRPGDFLGFIASGATVFYDDESDPNAGEVYEAPYFDVVQPMKEVTFYSLTGKRAYSIRAEMESLKGKHVESFMFSDYLGVQSRQVPDTAMSASSSINNHEAHRGRLDNTDYGSCSWTAEVTDNNQWLQVDLSQDTLVIGVVSQGHCGIQDQNGSPMGCVRLFNVQYSSNGEAFEYVTNDKGEPDAFESRCDCQQHNKNFFLKEVTTRYIRFIPVVWRTAISMRVEIIGKDAHVETTPTDTQTIGKSLDESNTAVAFLGNMFRRDGFFRGLTFRPLNEKSFTVAVLRRNEPNSDTFRLIGTAYVTSSGSAQGLQTFEIKEENEWIPVRMGDILGIIFTDAVIGFDESDDPTSQVLFASLDLEDFKNAVLRGEITFTSQANRLYHGIQTLVQVSTTKSVPPVMSTVSLGLKDGLIIDSQITASSYCDSNSMANRVRLGLKDQQGMTGGWCAKEVDQTGYIQIDFEGPTTVTGIVTQGLSSTSRLWFVQKYIVKCSVDMENWSNVNDENGNTMMFSGNYDQETEVYGHFSSVSTCRGIRVIPMMWVGDFPAMRLDIIGLPEVARVNTELGFDLKERPSRGSGGYTIVFPSLKFESDGFVTGIRFLPYRRGHFRMFIFRPIDLAEKRYKVVGVRKIKNKKKKVEVEVKFHHSKKDKGKGKGKGRGRGKKRLEVIPVKEGDMVGFSFKRSVFYKTKELDDVIPLHYAPNRRIRGFRRLRAGRTLQFTGEVQRSYSFAVLLEPKTVGEVVSSVDAKNPLGLANGLFPDNLITASSSYVSKESGEKFSPRSGRLKGDNAWAPTKADTEPCIQVDTEDMSLFTGVVTQGRHNLLNWWVTKYIVQYSNDETDWSNVQDCTGNQAMFVGNTDSDTEVTRYFCQAVQGRYLRICPKEWQDHPALRFEVLGSFDTAATEYGADCIDRDEIDGNNYILLAAGAPFQSDGLVTEWSFFPRANFPFRAGVWRPDPEDPMRWMHVGSSDIPGQTPGQIASYKLDDSAQIPFRRGDVMGWSFTDPLIPYDNGVESTELLYSRNAGKLDPTAIGAYRKFKSSGKQAYSISAAVLVSRESVPAVACQHDLGMASGTVADMHIKSSSILSRQYANSQVRLNTQATETMKGCWAPSKNSKSEFVQIDLGSPTLVTGISIQGCNGEERWLTKFQVHLSKDLTSWTKATDNRGSEIFYGNTDSDTVTQVFFKDAEKGQYVRIYAEEWKDDAGLRFEVHGCLIVCDKEWGVNPLVRQWKYSQSDRTFAVNVENPITCNSYIKGWQMIPKRRSSIRFYVLHPINIKRGVFKIVGMTRIRKSRKMRRREMYEHILEPNDWIEVRSGQMIAFSSRRSSPLFQHKRAHDKSQYMFARNRRVRNLRNPQVGDKIKMKRYKKRKTAFSFNAIITQEGVGQAKETLPPISCTGGLGMESGAIPDESISFSSAVDENPALVRLNAANAWTSEVLDPIITIKLDHETRLTGVSTQGNPQTDAWVTSFAIDYSASINYVTKQPQNYQYVKFNKEIRDIFPGNVDQNSVRTNFFTDAIEALYVRLYILKSHNNPSMRLELLGCSTLDPCDPNPCKNGALCRKTAASFGYTCSCSLAWSGKNCDIRTSKCYAQGDPHYRNFDGKKFNFQGDCTYVLTQTKATTTQQHFVVKADNVKNPKRKSVSITRKVFMSIDGKNFVFEQSRKVYVNEERISAPYYKDGVSVVSGANKRIELRTDFGLTVSWDGRSKVEIYLPEYYKNQVEGLCGNFNGDQNDDYIVRHTEEQVTNINTFAQSWAAEPECSGCTDCKDEDICRTIGKLAEAQQACSVLTQPNGPFASCIKVIDPETAYVNCMFDFCAMFPNRDNLCEDIEQFEEDCVKQQVQVGIWRKDGFCGIKCPVGMVYNARASGCPNTCGDEDAAKDCKEATGPMCECMNGLWLEDNHLCVPEDQCGCTHDGVYHRKNEKFMSADCTELCHCDAEQNANCEDVSCHDRATCSVKNHVKGCFCNEGFTGDGLTTCDEILNPQETVACEGTQLELDCSGTNERIEILDVEYSSKPRSECPDSFQDKPPHPFAKTIIYLRCHNHDMCSVPVDTTTFGSFDDIDWKALYVRYQCRQTVPIGITNTDIELTSCHGSELKLDCQHFKIDVVSASFGRQQGDHTCSTDQVESQGLNEDCDAPAAYRKVVEMCHTEPMCTINVVPDTFGNDNCPDVQKFLQVNFRCAVNPDPKVLEEDKCVPNPCQNGGICETISMEPKYNCKCPAAFTGQHCDKGQAICRAEGDPHYITFDGLEYDFMGHCSYTLVKNSDGEVPDFEIIVSNQRARRVPSMTSTIEVDFIYDGHVVSLTKGQTLRDGIEIQGLKTEKMEIVLNSPNVVIHTDIGLRIDWDGWSNAEVHVNADFAGHTEGLCGTYNGNQEDDYLTRLGEIATDQDSFGRSWNVPKPGSEEICEDCEDCVLPEPCSDAELKAQALAMCNGIIAEDGPFADCHAKVDKTFFYNGCVTDFCSTGGDISYCEDYSTYADECRKNNTIVNWRRPDFCYMDCSANLMIYSPSSSACPDTCANQFASSTCQEPDLEGCICPHGMVRDGKNCIEIEKCGCVDPESGIYYKHDQSFMKVDCSSICSCQGGTLHCEQNACQSNELCGTADQAPACVCKDGYFRDTESKKCLAVPVPQVLVRPQLQLECSTINCGTGFVNILEASFGPKVDDVCLQAGNADNCNNDQTLDIIRNMCQGQNQCVLDASTTQAFGEPCFGALNYIYIKFVCTHKPVTHDVAVDQVFNLRVCEDRSAYLVCPPGKGVINIKSVFFGRRAGEAYCLDAGAALPTEDRSDPIAGKKVFALCESKSRCSISGRDFEDTWPGSKEYLDVTYNCENPD